VARPIVAGHGWGTAYSALGDDLDAAVGHVDGRVVVSRVRRTRDPGRPLLGTALVLSGTRPRRGKIEVDDSARWQDVVSRAQESRCRLSMVGNAASSGHRRRS